MYRKYIKRLLDIAIAIITIAFGGIPMLIIAAAIKKESPGPAIFKQERLGLNGKVFEMKKFRSMKVNSEHTGSGVYSNDDDPRLTKVGKFLRKTSLDELPQAFNMLAGDMSLIGPRPPLTYHPWPLEEYTEEQKRMFEVRPGLTGWAQINGRRTVEWNERIKMNVWYVDHMSFLWDLKIFGRSFLTVFSGKNNENTGKTVKSTTEMVNNN